MDDSWSILSDGGASSVDDMEIGQTVWQPWRWTEEDFGSSSDPQSWYVSFQDEEDEGKDDGGGHRGLEDFIQVEGYIPSANTSVLLDDLEDLTGDHAAESPDNQLYTAHLSRCEDNQCAGYFSKPASCPDDPTSEKLECITPSPTGPAQTSYGYRRKTTPQKSPHPDDPNFSGIAIRFRVETQSPPSLVCDYDLVNLKQSTRSLFWTEMKGQTSPRRRGLNKSKRVLDNGGVNGGRKGGDEPRMNMAQVNRKLSGKLFADNDHCPCSSCGIATTPLWRDKCTTSGAVIPLCNACGIRLRKNGYRCRDCGYVARKTSSGVVCGRCENSEGLEHVDVLA